MSILTLPESPAQTPALDPARLVELARDCGAAAAARLSPFGSASRRFRRLVADAGDPILARDLVGAYVDSYRQTKAHRRELLAAVIEDDDRQAVAEYAARGL